MRSLPQCGCVAEQTSSDRRFPTVASALKTVGIMTSRQILVCEDDVVIAVNLCMQIEALGHIVLGPVANAIDALQIADSHVIDAAVIDLNLADGRSGLAIARERYGRGIPVILSSGDTLAPMELRDIKHIFVPKPIDEGLLSSCLAGLFSAPVDTIAA